MVIYFFLCYYVNLSPSDSHFLDEDITLITFQLVTTSDRRPFLIQVYSWFSTPLDHNEDEEKVYFDLMH